MEKTNKKITIELVSYTTNDTIKALFENMLGDLFRHPQKIKVEDIKE